MPRLGSSQKPARIQVRSIPRARKLIEFCKKHRWHVQFSLVPFLPENIDDIKTLIRQAFLDDDQLKKTGRNDPCLCGSGKKYKKCCLPLK